MRSKIIVFILAVFGLSYGVDTVIVNLDRDRGEIDRNIYGVTLELAWLSWQAIEGNYIERLNEFDGLWDTESDCPDMDEVGKLRSARPTVCRLMFEVGGGADSAHMHRPCYVGNDTWDKGGFDWRCWIGPPDSVRREDPSCWDSLGPDTVIYVKYKQEYCGSDGTVDSVETVSVAIYSPFDSTEEEILDKISSGEVELLYADTAYRTRWLWHRGSDSLILPSHLPVERTLYDILEVVDSLGCVPEFVIFEVCDTFIDDTLGQDSSAHIDPAMCEMKIFSC